MQQVDIAATFLADICANPKDDALRLIFADWLEDNGQVARAEFIRCQIEIDRMRAGPAGPVSDDSPWLASNRHYAALRRRERELLGAHWPAWTKEVFSGGVSCRGDLWAIRVVMGAWWFDCAYRRGFVASVDLTLADFMAHAESLFQAAPIEEVRLSDHSPQNYHNNSPRLNEGHLYGWCRELSNTGQQRHHGLPEQLWGLIVTDPHAKEHGPWVDFDTEALALAALSRAAVALGRRKAGLEVLSA